MYRAFALTVDGKAVEGYVIKKDEALKLQSTNIYKPDELIQLEARLGELNRAGAVSEVWPDANDPDVQLLLKDAGWEPLNLIPTEVVDEEKSDLIFRKGDEDHIFAGGLDEPELDEEASTIVYKTVMAPQFQTEVTQRIHKACQVVAERRLSRPERPA